MARGGKNRHSLKGKRRRATPTCSVSRTEPVSSSLRHGLTTHSSGNLCIKCGLNTFGGGYLCKEHDDKRHPLHCIECNSITAGDILCKECNVLQLSLLNHLGQTYSLEQELSDFQTARKQEVDEKFKKESESITEKFLAQKEEQRIKYAKKHNLGQWDNHNPLNLHPDLWLSAIVIPCDACAHETKQCLHLSGEEFHFFWQLRGVCKLWKEYIEEWLKDRPIILIGRSICKLKGVDPKCHPKYKTINIFRTDVHGHTGRVVIITASITDICICQTKEWQLFLRDIAPQYKLKVPLFEKEAELFYSQDTAQQYLQKQLGNSEFITEWRSL